MLARGASALRGVGEVRVSAELEMPEGEMETAVCRLLAVLGVEGVGRRLAAASDTACACAAVPTGAALPVSPR